mgnify:CR=1 FL=1
MEYLKLFLRERERKSERESKFNFFSLSGKSEFVFSNAEINYHGELCIFVASGYIRIKDMVISGLVLKVFGVNFSVSKTH